MDNSRLDKIKKWFDDWGEIEENDFNWLTERFEGYILAYEVILEENERMKKKLENIKEYYPELFI
jgi:archaellum component FlaC